MIIKNHKELLEKKDIIKQAIKIQEDQIKNNSLTKIISKIGNKKKLKNSSSNPKIEQGVNLALSTLSTQLLKDKNIGAFPKLALGIGLIFTGKFIATKISYYTSKK